MTRFALTRTRITVTVLLLIVVGGINAYLTLPQDEDPGFTIRTAMVITHFPGAGPSRVESLVTDRIEEVVQEIPELDFVESQSRTGTSIVFVNIRQQYRDMRPIWDNLRRKVDRIRPDLPEGVIGPVVDDEFGDVFGILLTLTGEGYSYAELKEVADEVREELLRLPDAAKVEIVGAQDERIFVEYRDARLAELGLSAAQLQQILQQNNIVIPGGDIRVGRERIVLEPSGNFESLEDLRRVVIRLPGRGDVLFLEDIAEVSRGYVDPPRTVVRANGTPALVLAVSLRKGGNVVHLGEAVESAIRNLESTYPHGIEFTRVANQPGRVERKVQQFAGSLLQAVVLVLLVMLFSLGLRTGLVVATLIPAAMLMALMIMGLLGVGLDQMSLAALIIALGMLIDNAIVMSEAILVGMREGKTPMTAALDAGRELRVPLLTSSLTTAAAFLPIYIARSQAGEYTGVIFVVVTITLLSSWILALTMTPLLCVRFLRIRPGAPSAAVYDTRFYRGYRAFLLALLRRRWITLAVTIVVFVAAMQGFRLVPNIFFPKSDRNFFTAKLYLPTGTDIAATDDDVAELERFLGAELRATGDREGVTDWAAFIGGGEPRYILTSAPEEPLPNYAFLLLNTTSHDAVLECIPRVEAFIGERFPDVRATVSPSELGPPVEAPIQIRISGENEDRLFALADRVKAQLADLPGTRDIGDDWGLRTKKLLVDVDQPRARRAGVTSLDVALSLQAALSGLATTEFREDDELVPIVVRSSAADRRDIGKLESLNVYSQATGRPVPLTQVADVRVAWEASKVFRRDRRKTVTVECNLAPGVTASEVNALLLPRLEGEIASWPRGYRYELGGEIETSGESSASIGAAVPWAVMIIVLLLVVQFNSFRKPVIVLATIPLGLIGVVLGLIAFRSTMGFMTLLGVVSLAGIVINNAIVLLERIQFEIDENRRTPQEAVLESSQRRLRPILLTTMTTIGGLIPLYVSGGPMWKPMAVAIMCGLLFATLLTLGVVPVLYSLFYRVGFRGVAASGREG